MVARRVELGLAPVLLGALALTGCASPERPASPPAGQAAEARSAPPAAPEGKICLAILDAECLGELGQPARTLAGELDTLLSLALAKRGEFTAVNRQDLDRLLAELKLKTGFGRIDPAEVGGALRPFWSAGVLVCPVIQPLAAPSPISKPPGAPPLAATRPAAEAGKVAVRLEAVLAQTGQLVAEVHVVGTPGEAGLLTSAKFAADLEGFWTDISRNVQLNLAVPLVEVADAKLTSPLSRLRWVSDDLTDALRSAVGLEQGVLLLRPRLPSCTKEERLLRAMGLSAPRSGDVAAGLQPVPSAWVQAELIEEPAGGTFETTPITIRLSWQGETAASETLQGTVEQYDAMRLKAASWLAGRLAALPARGQADGERLEISADRLAVEEVAAAKVLMAACASAGERSTLADTLRPRIAWHALRAAHLDPQSEEPAYMAVQSLSGLYPVQYDFRGPHWPTACNDRVIRECQRYLERFGKVIETSPRNHAGEVLSTLYRHASGEYYDSIWREAAAAGKPASEYDYGTRHGPDGRMHGYYSAATRALAVLLGDPWNTGLSLQHNLFPLCPPERLDEERAYWREFWRTRVEPKYSVTTLPLRAPPWEFVDAAYLAAKKDVPALRELLNRAARKYPRDYAQFWGELPRQYGEAWGGSTHSAVVPRLLKIAGDAEWETWQPAFPRPTRPQFFVKELEWRALVVRLLPAMPPTFQLPGQVAPGCPVEFSKEAVEPRIVPGWGSKYRRIEPLCIVGEHMLFVSPGLVDYWEALPGSHVLFVSPLSEVAGAAGSNGGYARLSLSPVLLDWPEHPAWAGGPKAVRSPVVVRCVHVQRDAQAPTVWLGTQHHGIARFTRKDGNWTGRWFTGRDGLPVEEIFALTSCTYAGQPRLLAVGLGESAGQDVNTQRKRFWTLDPADGKVELLAELEKKGRWTDRCVGVWPRGHLVPMSLYDRWHYPDLDLKDLQEFLPWQDRGTVLATPGRNHEDRLLWEVQSVPVNRRHSGGVWRLDPAAFQRRDFPLGMGPVDALGYGCPDSLYLPLTGGLGYNWIRQSPVATDSPVAPAPVAVNGQLLWVGVQSNPWGTPITDHLVAYRPPTSSGPDWADTDAWIGPLKYPGQSSYESIFAAGDHLLLIGNSSVHRVDVKGFLAAAPVQTTNQWRKAYQQRLAQAGWQAIVRMHLFNKRPGQAAAVLSRRRQALGRPEGLDDPARGAEWVDLCLWEGLVCRQMPERLEHALGIYRQLADSPLAEPAAKAAALLNLLHVAHQVRRWQQVVETFEELCATFPELKPRSEHDRFMPLVVEARKKLAAASPSARAGSAAVQTVAPAPPAGAALPAPDPAPPTQPADALLTLVRQAIAMKPQGAAIRGGQHPTGLDFAPMLAATGQDKDLKAFPEDRAKWKATIKALGEAGKACALAALLNHENVDVKIWAAQALERLAEPQTAPALLAAAKANDYFVEGSEEATIHCVYRRSLKAALEKITGLKLTPKGLRVTEYPQPHQPRVITSDEHPAHFSEALDFAKVEAWLVRKYLSAPATQGAGGEREKLAAWTAEAPGGRSTGQADPGGEGGRGDRRKGGGVPDASQSPSAMGRGR